MKCHSCQTAIEDKDMDGTVLYNGEVLCSLNCFKWVVGQRPSEYNE